MADPSPYRRIRPRRWRYVLLGVFCLCCAAAAWFLTDDFRGRRHLQAALDEARAAGLPVTFSEIEAARKAWPDDRNGALVLLSLQAMLSSLSEDKAVEALPLFAPGFPGGAPQPLGYRLPLEQDRLVAAQLERFSAELARIDELIRYEGGRFPVIRTPNPLLTEFPGKRLVRAALKLKASQAEYRVLHGNTSHVVDDVVVLFRHGRLVADEPQLSSSLAWLAYDALACDTIQRLCALAELQPEQLTKLQAEVARAKGQDRLHWGLLGERAMFVEVMDYTLNQNEETDALTRLRFRGSLRRSEAVLVRLQNRLAPAMRDGQEAIRVSRLYEREVLALKGSNPLADIVLGSAERCVELGLQNEAIIRATEAGLAAERYRLDRGHWPASLAAMVPAYLEAVPLDPFDDQPLRLRHYDGALLIYSAGADMTDDGGAMEGWLEKRSHSDWGFVLLPPERRGLPASQPATEPAEDIPVESPEEKAERLKRFREGGPRTAPPTAH